MAKNKKTADTGAESAPLLGTERELKKTVVQRELRRLIEQEHLLRPERVLEVARAPSNPLHKFFQWDNGKAAEAYRLGQAREMIRIVHVLTAINDGRKRQPITVRALVNVNPGKGFVMRNEALSETTIRSAVIERRIRELETWARETSDVSELSGIRDAVLKEVDRFRRESNKAA